MSASMYQLVDKVTNVERAASFSDRLPVECGVQTVAGIINGHMRNTNLLQCVGGQE